MSSKSYLTIAGVLLVVVLSLYFFETLGASVWIRRAVLLVFAYFAIMGQRKKQEEEKGKNRRYLQTISWL